MNPKSLLRSLLRFCVCAIALAGCSITLSGQAANGNPPKATPKSGAPGASKEKKKVAKKTTPSVAAKKPADVLLHEAHGNQPYGNKVKLQTKMSPGWIKFTLAAAPPWLYFEETTSTFRGVPTDQASVTYTGIKLVLHDTSDSKLPDETYTFDLPVVVGDDVTYTQGQKQPAAPPAQPATVAGKTVSVDSSVHPLPIPVPDIHLSSKLNSASISVAGFATPASLPALPPGGAPAAGSPPANYPSLAVEVVDPATHSTFPLSFTPAPGKPPVPTVPIGTDGSFTLQFSSAFSPGAKIKLYAVAPSGYEFELAHGNFSSRVEVEEITIEQAVVPLPRVNIPASLYATQTAIAVEVANLPSPGTAAAAADTTKGIPASSGNLASLAVELKDPLTGLWSRADIPVNGPPGKTAPLIQLTTDMPFNLPLKTALASGQEVRVVAIAPAGYRFLTDRCMAPEARNREPLPPDMECVVYPLPPLPPEFVSSTLTLVAPVITSKLNLNATTISGSATPSTTGASGTTVLIGVERLPLGDPCRHAKIGDIVKSDDPRIHYQAPDPSNPLPDAEMCTEHPLAPLAVAASGSSPASTSDTVQTQANGTFSLTLATPLAEEEEIRIVQILPPGTQFADAFRAEHLAYSDLILVPSVADWGRVHADFVAGLLTSNTNQIASTDSGNFSQAHEFFDLTVEKSWTLPGCYLPKADQCLRRHFSLDTNAEGYTTVPVKVQDKKTLALIPRKDPDKSIYIPESQNWWLKHHPGISSYFEGRVTAIAVSSVGGSTATAGATGTSGTSTSASSLLNSNVLSTAQTARFGAGAYFPALLQRWNWHGTPNALFIAPLAKVGFDSITGATSVNVPAGTPGASSTGTVALEPLYNFWGYGGRVGHFQLGKTENKSPETESFFDVIVGPYSNLQSYICKRTPAEKVNVTTTTLATSTTPATTTNSTIFVNANGYPGITGYSGSSCATDYPSYYAATPPSGLTFSVPADMSTSTSTVTYTGTTMYSFQPYDSRKRLYRLDFEGLLKIPMTPLYLGFNANLAQKTLGAAKLDHGYAAPDDLEIFFGTKFDIGELFAKLGIIPF